MPSRPKICVIASGGIGLFAPRPTHELGLLAEARALELLEQPAEPAADAWLPVPPPSACPRTSPSPPAGL